MRASSPAPPPPLSPLPFHPAPPMRVSIAARRPGQRSREGNAKAIARAAQGEREAPREPRKRKEREGGGSPPSRHPSPPPRGDARGAAPPAQRVDRTARGRIFRVASVRSAIRGRSRTRAFGQSRLRRLAGHSPPLPSRRSGSGRAFTSGLAARVAFVLRANFDPARRLGGDLAERPAGALGLRGGRHVFDARRAGRRVGRSAPRRRARRAARCVPLFFRRGPAPGGALGIAQRGLDPHFGPALRARVSRGGADLAALHRDRTTPAGTERFAGTAPPRSSEWATPNLAPARAGRAPTLRASRISSATRAFRAR